MIEPKFLRMSHAIKYYGMSRNTVMKWAGRADALYKMGRNVLVDKDKLNKFIEENKR